MSAIISGIIVLFHNPWQTLVVGLLKFYTKLL
jgi:hypothetical protein